MDFEIDEEVKRRVLAAVRSSVGKEKYMEFIALPGERCLVLDAAAPGTTSWRLVEPADLFGQRTSEDVTADIAEAMAADVRWLRYLNRRVPK